jgi:hypothetical protein
MIATEITTATRIGTRRPMTDAMRIATIDQDVRTGSILSPTAMGERAASTIDPFA